MHCKSQPVVFTAQRGGITGIDAESCVVSTVQQTFGKSLYFNARKNNLFREQGILVVCLISRFIPPCSVKIDMHYSCLYYKISVITKNCHYTQL